MHHHPLLSNLTTNELRELLKDVDTPAQVIAQRVALLQAIVGPASLTNVRLAGRHAHITGTRARYRVHLGSGVIHVEPAGTLVVRANPFSRSRRRCRLPTATTPRHEDCSRRCCCWPGYRDA